MFLVIATGNALIVLEFFLNHVKLFPSRDGRDVCHDNPFVCWHALNTAITASDRFERGNASGRWPIVIASCIHSTRIHGICQDMVDGAITPMEAATWSAYPKLPQMFGQTREPYVPLADSRQPSPPLLPLRTLPGVPLLDHGDELGPCDSHRVEAPRGATCLHDTFAVSRVSCGESIKLHLCLTLSGDSGIGGDSHWTPPAVLVLASATVGDGRADIQFMRHWYA